MRELTDLNLAAALIVSGHKLDSMSPITSSRYTFLFLEDGELQEDIDLYWGRKLDVDARSLCEEIRGLKARIHK